MPLQVLLTWRCNKSGQTGRNMMAQVQLGQHLWRAPWAAMTDTCTPQDSIAYIQVKLLDDKVLTLQLHELHTTIVLSQKKRSI